MKGADLFFTDFFSFHRGDEILESAIFIAVFDNVVFLSPDVNTPNQKHKKANKNAGCFHAIKIIN
jgi:hypothetical protein